MPPNTFTRRPRVRPAAAVLKSTIKEGTPLSRRWRVRQPSLNLYRMPLAVWDGYFNEVVRQKGLRSTDVELVGVFPVPDKGWEDLAVDKDRNCISYRFAGVPARSMKPRRMVVARDKSTGALYIVMDGRRGPAPSAGSGKRR